MKPSTAALLLSPKAFAAFMDALDNPKTPTQALRDLMAKPAPWEVPNRLFGARLLENGDAT